ncbi:ABC-type sugar transport system ATPase subunit [Bradyrhizobium sp. CIR48]|uniref:sugar ABC transporter ATP-binding protein n=1 Tax=Bradyrhizobium sp. CIR48 TaxID=2663840 RepID=UPI001606981C|nr:sugar ABC transporter ATP-binding protein [Bradyrhizobium sp. CIR48]MBB4425423.1 ABC-type sugar transport system ATPase subunit [Bradyrhizobium sp. CIR48]
MREASQSLAAKPLVAVEEGSKLYGGIHAIEKLNFDIRSGEVHSIVGENGAGKSTLCKAIAGAIRLSSGRLLVDGTEVRFDRPVDALAAGIAMVYQETSLVPTMTVAQNIELGIERLFDTANRRNIRAQQLLQSLNFHVEPNLPVSALGTAKRQMVEIARAVYLNARVIIFDEPTASLTPEEIIHFFHLIRDLRARGVGIVFISHALEEALRISDRITVLRDGKHVITEEAKDLTRDMLIKHMVGRSIAQTHYRRDAGNAGASRARGRKVLSIENVTMGATVRNMSFSLFEGEVLGIAGLIGSGRTEIARIVAGSLKRDFFNGGMIYLHNKPVNYRVPKQAIRDGIAYITEDRKIDGFYETMDIADNLFLGELAARRRPPIGYARKERESVAARWIKALRIAALNRNARVIELSGGNQQKVVIGKSLAQNPSIVIFDEPTRGVDVGAIAEIHQIIRRLSDEGKAVVVISSYLPEILSISDRILVARAGRIVAEFPADKATEQKIMYAAIH